MSTAALLSRLTRLSDRRGLHIFDDGRATMVAGGDGRHLIAAGRALLHTSLVTITLPSPDGTGAGTLHPAEEGTVLPQHATAVAVSPDGTTVALGVDHDNDVALYTATHAGGAWSFQRNITRMPLTPRAVTFDPAGMHIAVGGDDRSVRIVALAEPETGVVNVPVGRAIKTLRYDPTGQYLVVAGQDGGLTILDTTTPIPTLVKRVDNLRMAEGGEGRRSTAEMAVEWHPSGQVLAVGVDNGCHVLRRGSWEAVYLLRTPTAPRSMDSVYATTCGVAWSPNGRYLAAVDGRRVVTVWDMLVRAIDPATRKSVVIHQAGGVDASEPAVALQGFLAQLLPEGGEEDLTQSAGGASDGPIAEPTELRSRVTCIVWTHDGANLAFMDTTGGFNLARVADGLNKGRDDGVDTTTDPLDGSVPWPLLAPVRVGGAIHADEAADDDDAALAAVEEDGMTATGANVTAAPGGVKRKQRLVHPYTEGGDDDGAVAPTTAPAPAVADGVGRKTFSDAELDALIRGAEEAAATPAPTMEGVATTDTSAPVNLSISALKRQYGFVDGDDEDGEGGMRRLEAGGAREEGQADGREVVEELMASGKVVTSDMLERHVVTAGRYVKEVYGLVAPQAPFQPGATRNKVAKKRYLAWNGHGCIISRREVTGHAIAIEFADSLRHRSLSMSDPHGYTTAAMGQEGALFAAPYTPPSSSGDSKPAQLYFYSFTGSGGGGSNGTGHWGLALPVTFPRMTANKFPARPSSVPEASEEEVLPGGGRPGAEEEEGDAGMALGGSTPAAAVATAAGGMDEPSDGSLELDTSMAAESAVAVAVGDGWCVAGTDRQNVRFFRTGGVQDMVFTTPGDIVTVAGRGALCAVVYHTAAPSGYRQHLSCDVYLNKCSVDGATLPRRITTLPLPMRPYARLQWLGFSSNGMLCAHDTLGTLYATSAGCDWSWSPVCDTKAAALAGGMAPTAATSHHASHDVRDSMWPLDVTYAPPSVLSAVTGGNTGTYVDTSALAIPAPGGTIPMLTAVFCKGATVDPVVSNPRPMVVYLPLHVGIVETINADSIRLDEQFLRHELMRLHRAWLSDVGLHPATAASLTLHAALEAAANASKGSLTRTDAASVLMDMQTEGAEALSAYTRAIDKSVLNGVKIACESSFETKAVQLTSRLHLDKSFTVAQKIAGATHSTNAAERLNQLLVARQVGSERGVRDGIPGQALAANVAHTALALSYAARLSVLPSMPAAPVTTAAGAAGVGQRFGLAAAGSGAPAPTATGVGAKRPLAAMAPPPSRTGGGDDMSSSASMLAGLGEGMERPHWRSPDADVRPAAGSGGLNPFSRRVVGSPPRQPRVGGIDSLVANSPSAQGPAPAIMAAAVAHRARPAMGGGEDDDEDAGLPMAPLTKRMRSEGTTAPTLHAGVGWSMGEDAM